MTGDKSSRTRKPSAVISKGPTEVNSVTGSTSAERGENETVSTLLTGTISGEDVLSQRTNEGIKTTAAS